MPPPVIVIPGFSGGTITPALFECFIVYVHLRPHGVVAGQTFFGTAGVDGAFPEGALLSSLQYLSGTFPPVLLCNREASSPPA
jgi:hypothetical protein